MKYALIETYQDQMFNTSIICMGSKKKCIKELIKNVSSFVSSNKDYITYIEEEYTEDIEAGCSEYESIDELVNDRLNENTTSFELCYECGFATERWNWDVVKAA